MKFHILEDGSTPSTNLYVKILRKAPVSPDTARNTLFLIPGGPGGNHSLYADIEDQLLELADLVIPDLRGCGYSDNSDVKFCTLEQHVKDIEALRHQLGIEEIMMHGCSYGAMVALGYSISHGKHLSKLVLSSGTASGEFINSARENLLRVGSKSQITAAEPLWRGAFKNSQQFLDFYSELAPLYIFSYNQHKEVPTKKSPVPYNVELVNKAFLGFLRRFDYRPQLPTVTTPTLIFSGENDWITDTKQADTLHSGIKDSIMVVLKQCGHFPWKDQEKLFLERLDLFLSGDFAKKSGSTYSPAKVTNPLSGIYS